MNGDSAPAPRTNPAGTINTEVVTSQPASGVTSSYLRTGSTPTSYSGSPRLRRFDDMKKSYLGGGTGLGGTNTQPTSGYTSTSYTSKFSTGAERAGYRLASLDRLAQRQKLYETTGVEVANGTDTKDGNISSNGMKEIPRDSGPTSLPTMPSSSLSRDSSFNKVDNSSRTPISRQQESPVSRDGGATPTSNHAPHSGLQSKREMFFKSEGNSGGGGSVGGGGGGSGSNIVAPSSAPPAPPVTAPATAPPPPPAAVPTTNPSTPNSVASIKEQLLTTKATKEHKDEENKE
ncbi:unnamed protein product, partial [Meganyctiphanes norvegica]